MSLKDEAIKTRAYFLWQKTGNTDQAANYYRAENQLAVEERIRIHKQGLYEHADNFIKNYGL